MGHNAMMQMCGTWIRLYYGFMLKNILYIWWLCSCTPLVHDGNPRGAGICETPVCLEFILLV